MGYEDDSGDGCRAQQASKWHGRQDRESVRMWSAVCHLVMPAVEGKNPVDKALSFLTGPVLESGIAIMSICQTLAVWSKVMPQDSGSIVYPSVFQQLELIHVVLLYCVDGLANIWYAWSLAFTALLCPIQLSLSS